MNQRNSLILQAFIESWLGFMMLGGYIAANILHSDMIVIGFFAVFTAVLFMNGFAKTTLFLTSQAPSWWREHKYISWLHFASSEGELAGIFVGAVFLAAILLRNSNEMPHLPIAAALTLVGIMSAAHLSIKNVISIMQNIEQKFGTSFALFIGALLSSLTGAAASVFVCEYFKNRVTNGKKAEFATKFAAALGLGNGLLPFASPPVLIIWGLLQSKLNWNIGTLLILIGIPAIIYAFFLTKLAAQYVKQVNDKSNSQNKSMIFLYLLIVVVIANIVDYSSIYTMALNVVAGLIAIYKGDDFHSRFGSWILGFLLIALDIIGLEATEFINWLAITLIPTNVYVLLLGLILFYITAFISHFADNALASKLIITAAIATPAFATNGDFLASSVLLGALAGGFALIPANLPNFPIARILNISPNEWSKAALKIYYTMIFFIVWLCASFYFAMLY